MPLPALRERLARWFSEDEPDTCARVCSPIYLPAGARRVSVFFADLFGLHEVYNVPGLVDPANWTLRLPPTFEEATSGAYRTALPATFRWFWPWR